MCREQYSAIDEAGVNVCVAGRAGLAHYNCVSRRWKLFGNEAQEKDFVVTGGMLWWRDCIVIGKRLSPLPRLTLGAVRNDVTR